MKRIFSCEEDSITLSFNFKRMLSEVLLREFVKEFLSKMHENIANA